MILGIGVDIEEVKNFKENFKDSKFINLLFTKSEIGYCRKKKESYIHFAGKFCAKEAVIKAYRKNVRIKDVEVINSASGKVFICIRGKKQKNIYCSISHTEKYAMAFVLIEK